MPMHDAEPPPASQPPTLPLSTGGDGADRLNAQIAFVAEIDKLKLVLRQSLITDGSRQENTAEHSWHLAMCAMVLSEWAAEPVNVGRVVELLIVHDLVEIYAGDTFVYAAQSTTTAAQQQAAEVAAADRLFGLLPADQAARVRALWEEFESKATPESRFAKSIDRLAPMLLNHLSGGGSWATHHITADRPHTLIDQTMQLGSPTLAEYAHRLVDHAVSQGTLAPAPSAD